MRASSTTSFARPSAGVGIIGGSGLYQMEGVEGLREVRISTPFGDPSDALLIGQIDGVDVAFLPRHGRGHRYAPHEINYRANIWALKSVGVKWIFSVSAVGSMREDIHPGELVVIDQFIDRTRTRPSTFFEQGVVAHVQVADPVCPVLRGVLDAACEQVIGTKGTGAVSASPAAGTGAVSASPAAGTWHRGGTYVCIEGPQFSTRAESHLYRSWGASVVGMTNLPEARLAREAEIAYATLAMATDYDCWHESHDDVTVEQVLAVIKANVEKAQKVLRAAVAGIANAGPSLAWNALEFAIMTAPSQIPQAARERLALLIDHRLPTKEGEPHS